MSVFAIVSSSVKYGVRWLMIP